MQQMWWRLDNTAKVFSLIDKNNANIYRLSAVLFENIDAKILNFAVAKTLDIYPCYKVKNKTGLFWNYLEINNQQPIVEIEKHMPCNSINFRKNNNYLFKVTYYKNKINLDVFHILTDGVGAINLFKSIICNYIDIKYKLIDNCEKQEIKDIFYEDQYLKYADKKLKNKFKYKHAYQIDCDANFSINKTYHFIVQLDELKKICKSRCVTITEYLTALYILALYQTIYDKESGKDIILTIPINLRKYFNIETPSNFFTCMCVEGNIVGEKEITLDKLLDQIHEEFKVKLAKDNVKKYLARDVCLGYNIAVRLVPLFIKKALMKYMGKIVSKTSTSTLSNIGAIKVEEKYKKYIKNVFVLVNAGNIQKVKCTICSYENNLTITLNSNLIDNSVENKFFRLLEENIGNIKMESNIC